MKLICLISHPRSGSTSLMKKIESESNTSSVLEIFHMNEGVICQHIDEGLGKGTSEELKKVFSIDMVKELALKNPKQYLEYLMQQAKIQKKTAIFFKVFPNHIKNPSDLKVILDLSDYIVFLKRNSLHSFISNEKAQEVGTYANVDTSNIKITFCGDEFSKWRKTIDMFFSQSIATVESLGKEKAVFHYEELFDESDAPIAELYNFLGLENAKNLEIVKADQLKKQDNQVKASKKVSNPIELMEYLDGHDLSPLEFSYNKDIELI